LLISHGFSDAETFDCVVTEKVEKFLKEREDRIGVPQRDQHSRLNIDHDIDVSPLLLFGNHFFLKCATDI
jgi:hypothetical protein